MKYYRIRRTPTISSDNAYLMHYGVSIKNGAPGVGTGNWRRGGGSSDNKYGYHKEWDVYETLPPHLEKQLTSSGFKKQKFHNAYQKKSSVKTTDGTRKIAIKIDPNEFIGADIVKRAKYAEDNKQKIYDSFREKMSKEINLEVGFKRTPSYGHMDFSKIKESDISDVNLYVPSADSKGDNRVIVDCKINDSLSPRGYRNCTATFFINDDRVNNISAF